MSLLLLIFSITSANASLLAGLANNNNTIQAPHLRVGLVSESKQVTPGRNFWIAVTFQPEEHWHTYWRNPGDSGIAPKLKWKLPLGFKVGDIQWAYPEAISVSGIVNLGYHQDSVLLVEVFPPEELANSEIELNVDVSWLVCKESCIPGEASLKLALPVTHDDAPPPQTPAVQKMFDQARQLLPTKISSSDKYPSSFGIKGDELVAKFDMTKTLEQHPELRKAELEIFPIQANYSEPSQPATITWQDNALQFSQAKSMYFTKASKHLDFVIVADNKRAWQLTADFVKASAQNNAALQKGNNVTHMDDSKLSIISQSPEQTDSPSSTVSNEETLAQDSQTTEIEPSFSPAAETLVYNDQGESLFIYVVLSAILGGLLLNLMPCVFPVLAIKAISLVKLNDPQQARRHGLFYLLGVLASFCVLALVLWGLRLAGHQLGWGFQLQSPVFNALLASLFLLMALNLWGVYEISGRWINMGQNLTERNDHWQPFFTGVLAVVVASPCTAPFMAPALGVALTQPWYAMLLIFLGLGFGLALPFVLISLFPELQRYLPKPGAWMVRFKQFMAFPLLITAAWLLWVVGNQQGVDSIIMLIMAWIVIAALLWGFYLSAKPHWRLVGIVSSSLVIISLCLYLKQQMPSNQTASSTLTSETDQAFRKLAFTPENLQSLLDKKDAVFVNMTADWCLTCKINEKTVLAKQEVQSAFKQYGVHYVEGDWTHRNSEITQYLEKFDRIGVPLYVLYSKNSVQPVQVLPQILSKTALLESLQQASAYKQ